MSYFIENSDRVHQATLEKLEQRGVTVKDIAELVMFLQKEYYPDLQLEMCAEHVEKVLSKREVQNAVLTGIELDILAENRQISAPLLNMLERDESLYGVDETIALSIINIYGSIGFTNYGYIDKVKPGILKELNKKDGPMTHTFLDDLVGAIAAAASSRIAHSIQPPSVK